LLNNSEELNICNGEFSRAKGLPFGIQHREFNLQNIKHRMESVDETNQVFSKTRM